jgi:hypothetical protein
MKEPKQVILLACDLCSGKAKTLPKLLLCITQLITPMLACLFVCMTSQASSQLSKCLIELIGDVHGAAISVRARPRRISEVPLTSYPWKVRQQELPESLWVTRSHFRSLWVNQGQQWNVLKCTEDLVVRDMSYWEASGL